MGFILIVFLHLPGGNAIDTAQFLGVYASEQRCELAAIQIGAMMDRAKLKHLCLPQ